LDTGVSWEGNRFRTFERSLNYKRTT